MIDITFHKARARNQASESGEVERIDGLRATTLAKKTKAWLCAFVYRHGERTLTDQEVNASHERLVEQFKQKLQATIR